jgi:hypothetical protein
MRMKTSNRLIVAAIVLLVGALFAYDQMLKNEYLSGRYKDLYKDFKSLSFKDFDAVDLPSSTASNVKFIQGPYSVKIAPGALNYTTVKQTGNRLQIQSSFKGSYNYNGFDYILVISCPKLTEINASAVYKKYRGTQVYVDTAVRDDWHMRQVLIEGFNEDSISVKQNYGSTVVLSNNHIRALNAVVGISDSSGSKFIINKNNQINNAKINVLNRSSFILYGKAVQNLNYQLADSAKIMFDGAAQTIINPSKPKQK